MYHTSVVVAYRNNPRTRDVEFLVFEYRAKLMRDKEVRFPAGTNWLFPDDSPAETAVRKLLEETNLRALEVGRLGPKEASEHQKFGFLTAFTDCSRELRDYYLEINGDAMGVPRWVKAAELRHHLAPVHHWVLDLALAEVCALAA